MTGDTVLLVTASYDVAADYVGAALGRRGTTFFRLDTDRFPGQIRGRFLPEDEADFVDGDHHFAGARVKSVWYRRHVSPRLPPELEDGTREFCERETRSFLDGVLSALPTSRWLSWPQAIRRAEQKPYQLQLAAKLGFAIPKTVITNDPEEVRALAASCELVAKAVSSSYVRNEEGNRAIFTSEVTRQDLDDLEGLRLAPVIFQEFIAKRSDIRVTVVGDDVFCAEIHSQSHESSRVDWRATEDPKLRHSPHDLPRAVVESCRDLTRSLGLGFGAIDLALTRDGQYVFLEINPNGEWVWIEDQLAFPISTRIAEWLDDDEVVTKRELQVDERNRNVDGKLLGILSLASILSAVLTVGLTAGLTANIGSISKNVFFIIFFLILYISVQMICALRATVIGLDASEYGELDSKDVQPRPKETAGAYRLRTLKIRYHNIWFNEWSINRRVNQMKIAFRALSNAALGAGGVVAVAAIVAFGRRLNLL